MKILYTITSGDNGGAQRYVLDLARSFTGSITCGLEAANLEREAIKAGITCHPIPHLVRRIHPLSDLRALIQLLRVVREIRPDIIHSNSSKAGTLTSIAARLTGTPHVFTAHGFQYLEPLPEWKRHFFKFLERCVKPYRSFVITVSEADRQRALEDRVISESRSQTIYHSIPPPAFLPRVAARTQLNIPTEGAVVGTIANHYKTKGLDILLQAFAQLVEKLPNTRLVLIGDGPERHVLENLATDLGIAARVQFIGQKENAAQYLKAFDVFVLPSRKEGFPYTLLEALAAGAPIVTTDAGGNPEAVGNAAVVIAPENPGLLSMHIQKLLVDPTLRHDLATRAILQSQKFHASAMIEQTRRVYESILRQS